MFPRCKTDGDPFSPSRVLISFRLVRTQKSSTKSSSADGTISPKGKTRLCSTRAENVCLLIYAERQIPVFSSVLLIYSHEAYRELPSRHPLNLCHVFAGLSVFTQHCLHSNYALFTL